MSAAPSINGYTLDSGPEAFGALRGIESVSDVRVLRTRMEEDGYLYFPGFFDRADVLSVRAELVKRLADAGALEDGTDPLDAIPRSGASVPDLGRDAERLVLGNEPLMRLLYSGRMIAFFETFLDDAVRHFDHTWLRVVGPGKGTSTHTDIVFMGRGTTELYTAWVPYGDIPSEMGGLAILEGSHVDSFVRDDYGRRDVDTYCENLGETPEVKSHSAHANPILAEDAAELQRHLGGRWLTSEYKAGDLLIFGMFTVHAGIDNRTDRFRLSSDSRYQRMSEPVDERWVGPNPPGHTKAGKRGMIC